MKTVKLRVIESNLRSDVSDEAGGGFGTANESSSKTSKVINK